MRNISFAKTLEQVRRRQKTVTRRTGWAWLEVGTLLRPVEKAMGLKKGESITPIFDDGTCIRVVDVRRERLGDLHCSRCKTTDGNTCPKYNECVREGFPEMLPSEFVEFFCRELGATPDTEVTRIEFEYIDGGAQASLLGEGATDGS